MARYRSKQVNVALIGQKFMGRVHSNAYLKVSRFFDLPLEPVMHTVCGRDERQLRSFARRWGWANYSTNWRRVVADEEIDLVDVAVPNNLHAPMSIAAIEAGKAVACEKPLAATLSQAREMAHAARQYRAKTFVWFNYRRCPAVALAHRLVRRGRLGKIYHVRACYLQDWGGPQTPLLWRFDKRRAGSGAHGDLNAHIVDMARFITGDEIVEICGAISETFIEYRRLVAEGPGGAIASGTRGRRKKGKSTVDDCVLFLARFASGAVASFEATRLASGNQNRNTIEINGSRGSIRFDFERMNELQYYDAEADPAVAGWTRIMCTKAGEHPYADAWWPDAHIIGYEHGFVNMLADVMRMLAGKRPVVPMPDFDDALKTQIVLEAALLSAKRKRWVKISELSR